MFWIFLGVAVAVVSLAWYVIAVKVSKETTGTDDIDDPWDFGY